MPNRGFGHVALGVLIASLWLGEAAAQSPRPSTPPAAEKAAQEGLRTLRSLLRPTNISRFGFRDEREAESAQIAGAPFCEIIISPEQIAALSNGARADQVLSQSPVLMFPIRAGGPDEARLVASVTVAENESGVWEAVAFGARNTIASLVAYREQLLNLKQADLDSKFCLAEVPHHALHYVSFTTKGEVKFVIPNADSLFRVNPNMVMDAKTFADVLRRMDAK